MADLRLRADTLAGVFQRDITNWNDPAIAADNPAMALPDQAITVVHRADGSGTTDNFTRYLLAAARSWRLGSGETIDWPGFAPAGGGAPAGAGTAGQDPGLNSGSSDPTCVASLLRSVSDHVADPW
ncbi:substrate-binding domain-containing protein [Catellatospora tritici]|uniref:substrate-binding domain-containing protein n=1 Tax=Catellatospora tritici TaxID=2851566 RepID=UPI001C2D02A6|nr:substrate-binding domain-containing protein [Catellatospora tritici]MBV1854368.1 substrate-binding domain-containing protein [Catellatospora tritici]